MPARPDGAGRGATILAKATVAQSECDFGGREAIAWD
jgi:hypothetical protein